MSKRSRRHVRLERLEERRHLSSSEDGIDLRALQVAQLRQGPSAMFVAEPAALAGVVGGTAGSARQPTGALTGKTVFTVGGHGYVADNLGSGAWSTQRGETFEMVEDLGNQDQMTFYVNYLFNAGATVVPLRPVGYQPNEVLLDNDDAGVTYTGSWSNSGATVFYGSAGDVPYRFSATSVTESAVAKYQPNIPQAGFYPVYAWTRAGTDRTNQLYRVTYAGGVSEVRVNHTRVGNGYVYLGTYYFNAGNSGYVEISNQGAAGAVVIADHIRFGNGMGNIDRGGGVSGLTRSDESALYWIQSQVDGAQGVPTSEYRASTDDGDANVSAPPRWAEYMNQQAAGSISDRLFLSFHSNASGGRGDVGLFNGNNYISSKTPNQFEWASLIGNEVNDDLLAQNGQYEYSWFDTANPTLDRSDIEFGEINNNYINNEFDATILEVAYHDDASDAALMRDPKVRDAVARSSLQATIKYFNLVGGTSLIMPPDGPGNVRATTAANGDVTVAWTAPTANGVVGDAATGYTIYTSTNGYGFGNAITVAGGATLTYTIPAAQVGGATYFRVASSNSAGESMPSEVLAARSGGLAAKVLIVSGFDRLARTQNPLQNYGSGGNTIERVRPRFSNSFDYAVQAAEAIKNFSPTFQIDTTSNEALIAGQINLSNYAAVIWLAGEESTADDTFNATEQSLATTYLNAGGKLFVSGSELGWDLDAQGGGASFYNNQLKADYLADSAGTYGAAGSVGSIFAGISLGFDNGSGGTYNVNSADTINAFGGSTIAMTYTGGAGAAVQYSNPNGGRVVNMAIPFETITTAANRNAVMAAVLNFFALTVSGGDISGKVFRDVDGDGVLDGGEATLNGWTVFLDTDNDGILDGGETSVVTAGAGDYLFDDIAPASYSVRVVQQAAYTRTTPAGGVYVVNVTSGSATSGQNFGQFPNTYTGTSGADEYTIKMDPANNGKVQVIEILSGQGPATFTILKSLLSTLTFDGAAGDDKFTIDYTTGSPIPTSGIIITGGAHASSNVSDQIIITGSTSADNFTASGSTITSGGTVTYNTVERLIANLGAGNDVVTVTSPSAAVTFNGGTSISSDTLNVSGGTHTFATDAKTGTDNLTLNITSGALAVFNATQHLHHLNVAGGLASMASTSVGGAKVLVTKTFSITGGGKINLTDNDMVVNYTGSSTIASVLSQLTSGRGNNEDWTGAGIQTTTAGASGLNGLGYGEASDLLGLSGSETAQFSDETVDATSVLIKYTYVGDANLDGVIDGSDYFFIDSNVNVPGAFAYFNGDFNYDGGIDGTDYFFIDSNIAGQGPPL